MNNTTTFLVVCPYSIEETHLWQVKQIVATSITEAATIVAKELNINDRTQANRW